MDNPRPQGQAAELLTPEAMHWQAEREMAEALSAFQSQVEPAAELTLPAVVEAAKPAFRLGFSFSVRSNGEGTAVLLLHRSGAQQSAECESWDEDFRLSARLLAGLLGIPVGLPPQPSKAEEVDNAADCPAEAAALSAAAADGSSPEPASLSPAAATQPAREDQSVTVPAQAGTSPAAQPWEEGEPGSQPLANGSTAELDPALEPLSAEEISTLTAMLKELARSDKEAWKRFSAAFREHFAVPRTARTITDRITQRRHADFIDRFEQELAAGSGSGSGALAAVEAI